MFGRIFAMKLLLTSAENVFANRLFPSDHRPMIMTLQIQVQTITGIVLKEGNPNGFVNCAVLFNPNALGINEKNT